MLVRSERLLKDGLLLVKQLLTWQVHVLSLQMVGGTSGAETIGELILDAQCYHQLVPL